MGAGPLLNKPQLTSFIVALVVVLFLIAFSQVFKGLLVGAVPRDSFEKGSHQLSWTAQEKTCASLMGRQGEIPV